MQKYELMLLLNPNTMDEVDDFISSLKKLISDNKGDLIAVSYTHLTLPTKA